MAAPWETNERSKSFSSQVPSLPPISPDRRAVVPYSRHHEQADADNTIRLENLETRVNVMEQAHKMLLEELVNMQSRSQSWITRCSKEDPLLKEKHQMVDWSDGPNISQLLDVVQNNEKRLDKFESKMEELNGLQQKLEHQVSQLQESLSHLQKQIKQEYSQYHKNPTLTKLTTSLVSQEKNGTTAINELKDEMDILGKDHKAIAHRLNGITTCMEAVQHENRKHVETRSNEIWTALNELRTQLVAIETCKKRQDHWLKQSFHEINDQLTELSSMLSRTTSGMYSQVRKVEKASSEKQAELVSLVMEELNERDNQWKAERDEGERSLKHQLNELKKCLQADSEQQLCEHSNNFTHLEKQLENVRENFEQSHKQVRKSVSTLAESISLIEKENQIYRQHMSIVMQAEIKTRREEILNITRELMVLQKSCHETHDSLQNIVLQSNAKTWKAMAELHTSFQDNSRSDIASRINTQLNAQNDLEKRVDALHTEFQSLSKECLQHKKEQYEFEQGNKNAIREIHERLTELDKECNIKLLHQQNQETNHARTDFDGILNTNNASSTVDDVNQFTTKRLPIPDHVSVLESGKVSFPPQSTIIESDNKQLVAATTESKKTPTLLNEPIRSPNSNIELQSQSSQYLEPMASTTFASVPAATLQSDRDIEKQLDCSTSRDAPVINSSVPNATAVFIKFDASADECNRSWLNQWGIYQAVRLLEIKEKLMKPVHELRRHRHQH